MIVEFPALNLLLLMPAIGVAFNLFFGYRLGRSAVNTVSVGVVAIAFALSVWATVKLATMPPGSCLQAQLGPWIYAGPLRLDVLLRFDALAAVMSLVVSGVGCLIHIYSCGYMGEDPDFARYFAYMNLFTFSMLLLVLAGNLLLMFVGWEGVGLCSYLLIAFWYDNPLFAFNGRKAFVVNRIGDVGFLLGIFVLFSAFASHGLWTLDFAEMRERAGLISPAIATIACLLLFFGATGKSAQIPLYVWLPDAMVGPTPVSALIHAATMVTAGVYVVARLNFLFALSPSTMEAVATIGTVTAFFAATIALAQSDIKRVLAYSTISQIGYMFLGAGVGAFGAAIFHVVTHAFFKALLFLGAGSVIHALGGEQDMNRMGGLRRRMPLTHAAMLAGTLAISAVPGFSGFFSKDEILQAAYTSGHKTLWLIAVVTAGLTGLYMFRLFFLTFYGKPRLSEERFAEVHEPPFVMAMPLVVLAALSVFGGLIGLPEGVLWGNQIGAFLAPITGRVSAAPAQAVMLLSAITSGVTFIGIILALIGYVVIPTLPERLAAWAQGLYRLLWSKYYVDELYDFLITRPVLFLSSAILGRNVDSLAIDAVVDGTGEAVQGGATAVRRVETGNVQHYVLIYLGGVLLIVGYYLLSALRH